MTRRHCHGTEDRAVDCSRVPEVAAVDVAAAAVAEVVAHNSIDSDWAADALDGDAMAANGGGDETLTAVGG